jgi:hypothetical protein
MIHNLKFTIDSEGNEVFNLTIVTEVGNAQCTVQLKDLTDQKQPKLFAYEYEVLGEIYTDKHRDDKVMVEGLKKVGNAVLDVCCNNNWCAWSY